MVYWFRKVAKQVRLKYQVHSVVERANFSILPTFKYLGEIQTIVVRMNVRHDI